jgi:hypothetical protein
MNSIKPEQRLLTVSIVYKGTVSFLRDRYTDTKSNRDIEINGF